jgi:hypothetical protein
VPYIPCNDNEGTQVAFFFDNSKNLEDAEYRVSSVEFLQMILQVVTDFLRYKVFNYWSHFEHLVLGYYSKYSSHTEPGLFRNQQDIVEYLNQIQKSNLSSNIRR